MTASAPLSSPPRTHWWRRFWRILRQEGAAGIFRRLRRRGAAWQGRRHYAAWVRRWDTLTAEDHAAIARHIEALAYRPLISILLPVYRTPLPALRRALASVHAQLYPHWELCIADDASGEPALEAFLERAAREDKRIRVTRRAVNGNISAASNTALGMATGEFVALLDHDDELAPTALYHVAVGLNIDPSYDLLYSDEDKLDAQGRRRDPHFKPQWDPFLLSSQNYVTHLTVIRRNLMQVVGGFREGLEGSQDHDLVLRCSAATEPKRIHHLPWVLYHWRMLPGSTAVTATNKPSASAAGCRAVTEYWADRGHSVQVQPWASPTIYRVRFPLPEPVPVTLVVPLPSPGDDPSAALNAVLAATDYPGLRVLAARPAEEGGGDPVQDVGGPAEAQHHAGAQSLPARLNAAWLQADTPLVGLIHPDLVPLHPDWLREMASLALLEDVGSVGAKLLTADGRLHHAGLVLTPTGYGTIHPGLHAQEPGYMHRADVLRACSGLSAACLLLRREVMLAIGGFDERYGVTGYDVDLGLKLRRGGWWNAYTPFAPLQFTRDPPPHQPLPGGSWPRLREDLARLRERHAAYLEQDPYYNPNLGLVTADYRPDLQPRLRKPWQEYLAGSAGRA